MKNYYISFILFTVVLLISVFPPGSIYAQQDILQRVDADIAALDSFFLEIDNAGEDPDSFSQILSSNAPVLVQHLNESAIFYEEKIAVEGDEQLKTVLTNINTDVKGLSSSLSLMEEAVSADSISAYDSAAAQFDIHLASFDTNIIALNEYFGLGDYSWLVWPFLISLIISAVLFFISRGKPVLPAEQLRNKHEFNLFKYSLWPLGGSAVSYFWYLLTPPGGTFYVLYGPIAIGYIIFFANLFKYFIKERPAINLEKIAEQEKLVSAFGEESQDVNKTKIV